MEGKKQVYVAMSVDFIHHGHLNIINKARELGEVTIGLLTDKAIANYKRIPLLSFEQRKIIMENIKGVKQVIPQESCDYEENLRRLKPNYIVHGDEWQTNNLKKIRERVIHILKEWGGELIELPYTKGISARRLNEKCLEVGITPDIRRERFKRLINAKPIVRILEAHNGLTGLIVENTSILKEGKLEEFDAIWISSLTDSTAKGKPDIEFVDLTSRLNTIHQILDVTTKPIIVDGDTGGLQEHFPFVIKTLERQGVSAIIIEDKIGLKKNSLFGTDVEQNQDSIENFSKKISIGKKSQITDDFMIIARIESLILKKGIEDALKRAKAYIESGADAIMIHSKEKDPSEILEFCEKYSNLDYKVPLVVVPSTYSIISEQELINAGVSVVIYANHLLRSAYPAMVKTAESILKNSRCYEAGEHCLSIKDILKLIPGGE